MHHVTACDPFWDRKPHQTDEEYVRVKKEEFKNLFEYLIGNTVIAFVVELVTGAVGSNLFDSSARSLQTNTS
jgi:hypothetical protein